MKLANLGDKSVKCLRLNILFVIYFLLWIKYWLVIWKSFSFDFIQQQKKRPNISGIRVVLVHTIE